MFEIKKEYIQYSTECYLKTQKNLRVSLLDKTAVEGDSRVVESDVQFVSNFC